MNERYESRGPLEEQVRRIVEEQDDPEIQLEIPDTTARMLKAMVVTMIHRGRMNGEAQRPLFPDELIVVFETAENATPAEVTHAQKEGVYGILDKKLPEFPLGTPVGVRTVPFAVTAGEVEALAEGAREYNLLYDIDLFEFNPTERTRIDRTLTAYVEFLDQFVQAGGKDNERIRYEFTETLRLNKLYKEAGY